MTPDTSPDVVRVRLWGRTVGAVAEPGSGRGALEFQFARDFASSGLEIAPFHTPLHPTRVYRFPALDPRTFHGLPGFLADALPDAFGNSLIDAYMTQRGVAPSSITTLQRLLYMGRRAMGALEFEPAIDAGSTSAAAVPLAMASLVESARAAIRGRIGDVAPEILSVGTSAGGARAKAVVGFHPETEELVAGQAEMPNGFEAWLLKFDGVGLDLDLGESHGYGRVEYAYHLMAREAGIDMAACRLLEEGGRAHFMTRRFDRQAGEKLHLQTLCAMQHADFNRPGAYDYELLLRTLQALGLGKDVLAEAFRRMTFNVAARNCDDHTKNVSFLMDPEGVWRLAPAYDLTFAHNPSQGKWTRRHQMLIAGKGDDITREDLTEVARSFNLRGAAHEIERVVAAVRKWPEFAQAAGVEEASMQRIAALHVAL